jgi:acetate kinase
MRILVLNGGSSSFKCALYEIPAAPDQDGGACADRAIGLHETQAARSGEQIEEATPPTPAWKSHIDLDSRSQIAAMLPPILASVPRPVDMAGHRVVHGGEAFRKTTALTPAVRSAIAQQAEIAPSHNRLELAAIEAVDRVFGADLRQTAVFDTAFHATLAPAAYVYPGPYEWREAGIRRYGFHGISHQYASRRASAMLHKQRGALRLITCHLGNGASLAAVRGGKSIDTTMGFTPVEGLMMGTRSGSIDPGILIYLLRHRGYTPDQLDRVLNQESGLLGVSGISGDMRPILAAMGKGDLRAQLAFDVYAHRLVREIGGMLAALGGVDALVFTGGVGENCPPLREAVAKQFEFLGLKLDAAKNARPRLDQDVAAENSAVRVLVIHAEEDWEIARECYRLAQ